MQGYSRQPQQLQQGCYSPHCTDGVHEDQGAAWMLCKDVVQELITLRNPVSAEVWNPARIWVSARLWISTRLWITHLMQEFVFQHRMVET